VALSLCSVREIWALCVLFGVQFGEIIKNLKKLKCFGTQIIKFSAICNLNTFWWIDLDVLPYNFHNFKVNAVILVNNKKTGVCYLER
jgi:hypothetical protein